MKENVYLIACNSYHLLNDEIKKITANEPYTTYDLNNTELEEILEEAAYFSLFDEKKYIVVKNSSLFGSSKRLKKDGETTTKSSKKEDKLIKYLEEPNKNTILIFTLNGKIDGKKKICKLIKEKYTCCEIGDLSPKEIHSKIESIIIKEGYKIDYKTLNYIITSCQNNYDLARNEIEKVFLYYNQKTQILMEDVQQIVSKNILDNNFKFIDAIINHDLPEAFLYYDDFMLQKIEPLIILNMLAKEYRQLLLIKRLINHNSKKELMQKINISYEFQIDKLINSSYLYNEKELENNLIYLCDLDYKIKNGHITNKIALQLFILKSAL